MARCRDYAPDPMTLCPDCGTDLLRRDGAGLPLVVEHRPGCRYAAGPPPFLTEAIEDGGSTVALILLALGIIGAPVVLGVVFR